MNEVMKGIMFYCTCFARFLGNLHTPQKVLDLTISPFIPISPGEEVSFTLKLIHILVLYFFDKRILVKSTKYT